jgi:hypothetical protein
VSSDVSGSSADTVERPAIGNRPPVIPGSSGGYVLRPRKDGTFVKRCLYDKSLYNNDGSCVVIEVYDNDDGEQCLPLSFDEILYEDRTYEDRNSYLTIENLNKHNRSTDPGIYGYVVGWGRAGVKRYLFKSIHYYGDGNTREVFMYEDDEGEAWTIYSDVHIIYYDD